MALLTQSIWFSNDFVNTFKFVDIVSSIEWIGRLLDIFMIN